MFLTPFEEGRLLVACDARVVVRRAGRMPGKTASILAAALLLLAGTALPGRTASLDKDACNKLKTEQDGLEKSGVRALMAKGSEWAKANLSADKLDEVRRTIELMEHIQFRWTGKPNLRLPPCARHWSSHLWLCMACLR